MKGLPFWKLVFGRHNLTNEWDKIKDHVQSHPDIWQVYLAELKHKFIDRNLVKNHSGHGKQQLRNSYRLIELLGF